MVSELHRTASMCMPHGNNMHAHGDNMYAHGENMHAHGDNMHAHGENMHMLCALNMPAHVHSHIIVYHSCVRTAVVSRVMVGYA